MKIGILALQGNYEAHAQMLERLNVNWQYVRTAAELIEIDGLIIPGGESPTMLTLLDEMELYEELKSLKQKGMPVFGTCAGAILLADKVVTPVQKSLGFMHMTIARNAYGRQLSSFIDQGENTLSGKSLEMCFIRAPKIAEIGSDVNVIARYHDQPVCVEEGPFLAATFHPELTADICLHEYFINKVKHYLEKK